jgi:polygalacturonase
LKPKALPEGWAIAADCETMVMPKGKMSGPGVLLGALAFAACVTSLAAPSRALQGCVEAPASPLVVNVKDKGAKGDGQTDDTAAIQAAIDQVAGTKGTVLVPNGTYLVDAAGNDRLALKSDMTLKLSKDATLKAIPNDSGKYSILTISIASSVTVSGGTLEGDRQEHTGKSSRGASGYALVATRATSLSAG